MMQGGMAAGSQLMGNAQARNNGQQTGFLGGPGAIDGTSQSVWNVADPFNTTGHASSGHAISNILDPGNVFGFNQAANPNAGASGQTAFPNLGAASMIPQMPQGSFGAIHNGAGPYNAMAAQGAGNRMFNPAGHPAQTMPITSGGPKPTQSGMAPMMAKPISPIAVGTKRH